MSAPSPPRPPMDEEAVRGMARRCAGGEPSTALARESGATPKTVLRKVRELGVAVRPKGGRRGAGARPAPAQARPPGMRRLAAHGAPAA